MTHRLSRMRGLHVSAKDGDIGHVDDFLLDEATWQVKYVVVDTSNWIGGSWVALSTQSIGRIDWGDRQIYVDLTRAEIKASPTLDETNVPSWELTPRFIIM